MKTLIIYKEVDIDESIEVAVDLDFEDIKNAFEKCDDKEKQQLSEILNKTQVQVLEEAEKMELIKSNLNRFSYSQLERFINSLT